MRLLKGGGCLQTEVITLKAFAMKHECWYTYFNHGKSGKQRKTNKRLGKKQMRNRLKKDLVLNEAVTS
jgi:hypothetical protein